MSRTRVSRSARALRARNCTVGATAATTKSSAPTKLTSGSAGAPRELSVFKQVAAEYDKAHPTSRSSRRDISDTKIVAAIAPANARRRKLVQLLRRRHLLRHRRLDRPGAADEAVGNQRKRLPGGGTELYTQYNGKRCALPLLADTYGLYYNRELFEAAGITSPPKTISELAADAKKLTKFNADGSIKVARLRPVRRGSTRTRRSAGAGVRRQMADAIGALDPLQEMRAGRSASSGRRAWSTGSATTSSSGSRRAGDEFRLERVRGRQARDEHRRRVARRVHPGASIRS